MPFLPQSKDSTRDECTMKNIGDISVSLELLVDALNLPRGTEIREVFQTQDDRLNGVATLRVEHESLPEHNGNGAAVSRVAVMYEQTYCYYDWN